MHRPTIESLAADLAAGRTTSEALTNQALERIEDAAGEGSRTFIAVYRPQAIAAARASDLLRTHGMVASVLAGLPISIKDLFDVAGDTTLAGSVALRGAPPARRDATIVGRLRAAGAVLVGRTNMTEFAFGALGINPHYGTPGNPADRARVPGGSSSGAAVSVADGMAVVGIGSDTGGSVRIPAALCGLYGYKPTQFRVPLDGAFPLSSTLDSIGPLASSMSCCALVDAVMAGMLAQVPAPLPLRGMRFAVPAPALQDTDALVAGAFARACGKLSAAGASIVEIAFSEMTDALQVNATRGFAGAEAYALHRALLAKHAEAYDPRVLRRIQSGAEVSAADYIDLQLARARLIASASHATRTFDALLLPTVPVLAPRIADARASDASYFRQNALLLRNCSFGNFLDRCAATVPCHLPGELPVGLMLLGEHGADSKILALGQSVEAALAR